MVEEYDMLKRLLTISMKSFLKTGFMPARSPQTCSLKELQNPE
jgi:hypothetical protein